MYPCKHLSDIQEVDLNKEDLVVKRIQEVVERIETQSNVLRDLTQFLKRSREQRETDGQKIHVL